MQRSGTGTRCISVRPSLVSGSGGRRAACRRTDARPRRRLRRYGRRRVGRPVAVRYDRRVLPLPEPGRRHLRAFRHRDRAPGSGFQLGGGLGGHRQRRRPGSLSRQRRLRRGAAVRPLPQRRSGGKVLRRHHRRGEPESRPRRLVGCELRRLRPRFLSRPRRHQDRAHRGRADGAALPQPGGRHLRGGVGVGRPRAPRRAAEESGLARLRPGRRPRPLHRHG